jgi:hypothetical protein
MDAVGRRPAGDGGVDGRRVGDVELAQAGDRVAPGREQVGRGKSRAQRWQEVAADESVGAGQENPLSRHRLLR